MIEYALMIKHHTIVIASGNGGHDTIGASLVTPYKPLFFSINLGINKRRIMLGESTSLHMYLSLFAWCT